MPRLAAGILNPGEIRLLKVRPARIWSAQWTKHRVGGRGLRAEIDEIAEYGLRAVA